MWTRAGLFSKFRNTKVRQLYPHLLSYGYSSFTRCASFGELTKVRTRREAAQRRQEGITFGMFRRDGLRGSSVYTAICRLYDAPSRGHLGLHSCRVGFNFVAFLMLGCFRAELKTGTSEKSRDDVNLLKGNEILSSIIPSLPSNLKALSKSEP